MTIKFISTIAVFVFPAVAFATEYQTVERPRQQCWNEQVQVQPRSGYGGAIVGGIAGGLLGNQVGRGNGRTVATAVGAMTGAMVGDRLSSGANFTTVRRCRTILDRVQLPVYEESPDILVVEQLPQYVQQRGYYYDRRNERDYRWQDNRNHDWKAREHEHEHDWERRRQHEHEHHQHEDDDDD
jgi:uncharacterized protein YcfJ